MQFSRKLIDILRYSEEEAIRTGHGEITADHLLLGLLRQEDNCFCQAISHLGIAPCVLKDHLDSLLFKPAPTKSDEGEALPQSRDAQSVMNMAVFRTMQDKAVNVGTRHLAMAVFECSSSSGSLFLKEKGLTSEILRNTMLEFCEKEEADIIDITFIHSEDIVTYFNTGKEVQS